MKSDYNFSTKQIDLFIQYVSLKQKEYNSKVALLIVAMINFHETRAGKFPSQPLENNLKFF